MAKSTSLKAIHTEEANAVAHVDCPVCVKSLGIVEASTGAVEEFECTECGIIYRVVVQSKAQGRVKLSFFDITPTIKEQYDRVHFPV